jgi:hypothetical protein
MPHIHPPERRGGLARRSDRPRRSGDTEGLLAAVDIWGRHERSSDTESAADGAYMQPLR